MDSMQGFPELGFGIGPIGPRERLRNGGISLEKLHEVLEALTDGAFFVQTQQIIPTLCVDGRPPATGSVEPAPNSAGGTFSLAVGEALARGHADDNAAEHARTVYAELLAAGYQVGGHDADHASGDGCGCGAEDKLADILAFIAGRGADIRKLVASLGEEVGDSVHTLLTHSARELLRCGYADVSGKTLRDAYVGIAGEASVVRLSGPHNEIAAVINTKLETIDRAKLRAAFGDNYQTFDIDVAALREAAKARATTDEEAAKIYLAMLYYNVATAAVLSDQSLRIVVR